MIKWHTRLSYDDYPTEGEGWYRVSMAGDSESLEGFTLYSFPDYEGWAYWTPASSEEYEDFEGGYKGSFNAIHDEENESILAFYGPIIIPSYKENVK